MKKIIVLLACLALTGCASVLVQKEIQVKKDANGKIIETTETERAIQRGYIMGGLQLDYLKSKQGDSKPAVVYKQ